MCLESCLPLIFALLICSFVTSCIMSMFFSGLGGLTGLAPKYSRVAFKYLGSMNPATINITSHSPQLSSGIFVWILFFGIYLLLV
jgi:hypothetical protein